MPTALQSNGITVVGYYMTFLDQHMLLLRHSVLRACEGYDADVCESFTLLLRNNECHSNAVM
jgi:hypothetical protein